MDLLHESRLDGFCLVSSDSDFTRLATRIREAGLFVYGFGEEKTPEPFISACDKFIYTEILREQKHTEDESENASLRQLITSAIEAVSRDDGWALLSTILHLTQGIMAMTNWASWLKTSIILKRKKKNSTMVLPMFIFL
jgi:hypothetical protein